MEFRIHGTLPDGTEDSWLVDGDTIEDIQEKAQNIVKVRELTNYWSEEL